MTEKIPRKIAGAMFDAGRIFGLEARIAQLEAALKAVEWVRNGPHRLMCEVCLQYREEGHAPECLVGRALKP